MKKLMALGMFSVLGTAAVLSLDTEAYRSHSTVGSTTIGAAGDGIVDSVAQSDDEKKKKKKGSGESDKRGS